MDTQAVDQSIKTSLNRESSLFFILHFNFIGYNLEMELSHIVSTSLNSIGNKLSSLN